MNKIEVLSVTEKRRLSQGGLSSHQDHDLQLWKFRIASHKREKFSERVSGERHKTMIAHTAGGMRNHGFRAHKSPGDLCSLCLKFHSVRPVT
jgi:hypothetical protein